MAETSATVYPTFDVKHIKHPNRYFAFPILGFFVKLILLIPVFLEILVLVAVWFVLWFLNSFVILYSGKYWNVAYTFTVKFMRYYAKAILYTFGLTDIYPGFSLEGNEAFDLSMEKPEKPNRWLAIPIVGFLIRVIVLIPFHLYRRLLSNSMRVSLLVAWYPIMVDGKFPTSLYELERDALHVTLREFSFLSGLNDSYPSFKISMSYQTVKVLFIILGALILLLQLSAQFTSWRNQNRPRYLYQNNMMQPPHQYMYHYNSSI